MATKTESWEGKKRSVNDFIMNLCLYRYLTVQLHERTISPTKLEIAEIEVEGWARSCGSECIQGPIDSILGTLYSNNDHKTIYDWRLVRYAPQRSTWHDASDLLRGTHSYGTSFNTGNAWSITWAWNSFDDFLFKVGDEWIIINKIELLGSDKNKYYSNTPIKVIASSEQCDPHTG